MKIKKQLLFFTLIIMIMSCLSTISATSNENMNSISDADSFLININEQSNNFSDSCNNLLAQENSDVNIGSHNIHDLMGNDEIDEDDENDEDDNELDDEDDEDDNELDDEDDEDDNELDDDDIDEYFESLNTSSEYLKFLKYLIKEKGFKFNNHLEDENNDTGYSLYASRTVTETLYDGRTIDICRGYEYYIPINQRSGYILDTYYPDVIYERFNQYAVDEIYLGWLKWEEDYQILNISNNTNNISLKPSSTLSLDLPSHYDLRNDNGHSYVTSVKDQKDYNNCWAFASIAALESHLLKSENISYEFSNDNLDFSENNLKNVMSSIGELGLDLPVNNGSWFGIPISYFIRWSGPILESQDEYINDDVIEDYKSLKHVQGLKYISPRKNSKDNDEIKQAIYEYGGVVTSIYWNNSIIYEDGKNYFYFMNPLKNATWHSICIVGWDDNYSKTNFKFQTEGMEDGAFIVKNSYGSNVGDAGYYYVSYYDTTLARYGESGMNGAAGFAFTLVENNTNFGKNYHYTPLGVNYWFNTTINQAVYANQWKANCNETLTACGIYVNDAVNCSIFIFVDDIPVDNPTSVQLNYSGFHTIVLNTPVNINKGQTYRIAVALMSNAENIFFPIEAPGYPYSKVSSNANESFYFDNGKWYDLNPNGNNKLNFALHAYTEYRDLIPTKIEANDLSMVYGENRNIVATLFDAKNDTPLKNFELTFYFDDEEYDVITNEDGQASLTINNNHEPGTYKVSIHFFGNEQYSDVRKTITLVINNFVQNNNQIIIQKKNVNINGLKDVKIGQTIVFSLTSDEKPLKNKKITVKIGSKTYKDKKLDKNGKYTLKNKLTKKASKITVIFNGDNNYNAMKKYAYIYQEIKKIDNLKKKVKYNEKFTVSLNVKKLKYVYFKNSNKEYKIKFKNGKATFKVGKYNFKKGKTYYLKFYSKSKLYRLNVGHMLTIMK